MRENWPGDGCFKNWGRELEHKAGKEGEAILCAIYTRLSKEDEDKQQSESESIQNQKSLLTSYARDRGWEIYHVYCDEDYSGADSLRPDFNRMMDAASERKFQIILCKSQSRFTRDIENIRMVFDMKRRQGQYIGGFPIYGYRKDPNDKNHLIVDPEAAEVVRKIYQWALEGHGKQNIACMLNTMGVVNPTRYKAERGWSGSRPCRKDFGIWNKNTVWRILHNEMYTGVMVQGRVKKASYKSKVMLRVPREQWFRVEGTHEAIIDPKTFQTVQNLMALRTREDGTGSVHPLAGLVKCMDCGSTMSKSGNGRKAVYYLRCKLYADSGEEKLCTRHSIRLDRLIDLVRERLRAYIQQYFVLEEGKIPQPRSAPKEVLNQEQKTLAARLEKRSTALRQLYLDRVSGVLTEGQFVELNQDFLAEKSRLETRLAQIDEELAAQQERKEQKDLMEQARKLLELNPLPRELAAALIQKIEIGEPNPDTGTQEVKIYWKF